MTLRLDAAALPRAAALLAAGGLVAMPTETVYGLAADALDPSAVARVFAAKARPADDPLIVHLAPELLGPDVVDSLEAQGWIAPLEPARAAAVRALVAAWWPGPLTLVLPRGPVVIDAVTAGLDAVALRMPAHPLARALVARVGRPLVAPSANRFGRVSPTDADGVLDELDGRIDAVLDGGPCAIGVESTVARVEADGSVTVLRPGALGGAALAATAGSAVQALGALEGSGGSPGRLPSHYAPSTPLAWAPAPPDRLAPAALADLAARAPRSLGWITWSTPPETVAAALHACSPRVEVRCLAPDGEPATAARALYATLRALDVLGLDVVVVEAPPGDEPLEVAIRDRLARATHGTRPVAG